MREIKFRAWEESRFQYFNAGFYIAPENGVAVTFYNSQQSYGRNDDLILEQFTGLKDNKGVDIYEGDIVKVFGSRRPQYNGPWQLVSQFDKQNVEARAVIVWKYLEWQVDSKNAFNSRITELKGSESEERTLGITERLSHFDFFQDNDFNKERNSHCYWATIEVIGNIHENGELIT